MFERLFQLVLLINLKSLLSEVFRSDEKEKVINIESTV